MFRAIADSLRILDTRKARRRSSRSRLRPDRVIAATMGGGLSRRKRPDIVAKVQRRVLGPRAGSASDPACCKRRRKRNMTDTQNGARSDEPGSALFYAAPRPASPWLRKPSSTKR
jgi:hypothetical protein